MSKYQEQIRALAEDLLVPGEECLGAVRANYNGTVPGNALANAVDGPPTHPDALVAFPSARQMAIALTGGRMLVWSLSFSGKPRQFLGEVPLVAVGSVEVVESQLGGVLRLHLRSGASVDLEGLKGEPMRSFVDQLTELCASG